MALGNVFVYDTDGNIGVENTSYPEKVCGMLFDISEQTDIWTSEPGKTLAAKLKGTVVEVNSLIDAKELGINSEVPFLQGIPLYHITHFFRVAGGTGRLFLAFRDCSTDWNALIDMQKAAGGSISQFGIWTEQCLWREGASGSETYLLNLVSDIQETARLMRSDYHSPAVMVLNANTAKIKGTTGDTGEVVLSKIPSCINESRDVAVYLSQARDPEVAAMQAALASCTPVGTMGAALGCLTKANVAENIGHIMNFELSDCFADIEMGFGNATVASGAVTDATPYDSLSITQLNKLDDLGYNFLYKQVGLEGQVFFSNDHTCSVGDYRSIARNRVINKARRSVRTALLPYVNAPIKLDPKTGQLSTAQITVFKNLVTDILSAMDTADEIAGPGTVDIPVNQNILKNDALQMSFTVIPMGCSTRITVTEGFVLHS